MFGKSERPTYLPPLDDASKDVLDGNKRLSGLRRTARSARSEVTESPNRKRTLLAGAQLLLTQGLDRARFAILVIPPAVVETMEHTNNSITAGAVGAGMFAVWGAVVGESTLRGLNAFPRSVETFEREHPKFVNFFAEALPGMKSKEQRAVDESTNQDLGMHLRRAGSSVSLGTSPFVATAKATGYDTNETRKMYAGTSLDGAALVFAVAAGVTEGIKRLAIEGHYELAQDLQNIVENNKTWWTVAGVSILLELISNKFQSKEQRDEFFEMIPIDKPIPSRDNPVDKPIPYQAGPVDKPSF